MKSALIISMLVLTACKVERHDEYLFSSTVGFVFEHGSPAKGVVVERRYRLEEGDWVSDRARTDQCGRFSFEEAKRQAWLRLMGEVSIEQEIWFRKDGQDQLAWQHTKTNLEKNGELGAPAVLLCDSGTELAERMLPGRGATRAVLGVCGLLEQELSGCGAQGRR